jgi:hypothetical protein
MTMCSVIPPFREAKFCGVPSCVFDKLGCAAGERSLRNTAIGLSILRNPVSLCCVHIRGSQPMGRIYDLYGSCTFLVTMCHTV